MIRQADRLIDWLIDSYTEICRETDKQINAEIDNFINKL